MSIPEIVYCILALAFCAFFVLLKWNEVRYSRKGMPPGTMGWPIFGETAGFLKQGPDFMKCKRARYGNLLKSHALGSPIVISMDPELNRYILKNEAKGLVPGYPVSMRNILGKSNIAEVHGALHKRIRGSILSFIGPAAIRGHLLPEVDKFMTSFLDNWDDKTIDIQQKTKQMAFFVSMKLIVENEPSPFNEAFKATFDNIVSGTFSLPINIPGTNYFRGLQTRKKVVATLKEVIAKRRSSLSTHADILDQLMRNEDSRYKLNDEEIIDQIITFLYSGYETVSTTTMMAVKYLHDNPRVLEEVRKEHFAIQQSKRPEDVISWDDYKLMVYTRGVIFETLRLANIVNGVLRKATTDVELNGFTIPQGWRVYVYTRETNCDPFLYRDPCKFNPSRWLEKGLEYHNHNMLFGAGVRMCPGKELGILIISLFLHYFVTTYRWEVERNKLLKFPRVEAPNGLYIKVSKY
ncbi:cytochrome P450 85A-like isoform X1 [Abrus precatorius]|uniref:Cytochrome P450 85A-like isoform X1 n=1 Tax=Abrus precatorius TaxID=3816 RepID=A0A8B8M1G2_ABRPR|nr:cytochrome P450 85A-like isoform X1 [Abrus precatorius]